MGHEVPEMPQRDPDWEPRCETARSFVAPKLRAGIPLVPRRNDEASLDLEAFKSWTPDAQQRALDLIKQRQAEQWNPFYCQDPLCSGQPHEDWDFAHARQDQWPPPPDEDWLTWLLAGGRGSGKTRTGSEVTHRATKIVPRIALIAPTGPDLRDTMIEGVSGILATARPDERPLWEPSKKRLTWPNGCIAQGFSAEEPDRLRGPQFGWGWMDEPAHYPLIQDVWDNLLFGLRLGRRPRIVCTTTPLPTKWMRKLIADPKTRLSRVSTYANLPNLAETFRDAILERYEGTRLGRQELHGEVLEDVEGAMWAVAMFRYTDAERLPHFDRVVVSIDPAGSVNKKSDETGIIVLGIHDRDIYVLADRSGKYTPSGWATAAMGAYDQYSADAIVVERNYGGDMVRETLEKNEGESVRIIEVNSRRGKALRAEPIVALYERERVFHIAGRTTALEDEQVSWIPGQGDSPNRVDALVHGITELGKIAMPIEVASPTQLRRLHVVRGPYGQRIA